MALAPIGLAGSSCDQFLFDQTIDNAYGGMMFHLKPLTELGNGDAFI